ncbi:hypothetical protein [Vulcanococcus sp.]|uniref:hypothetical protein n=1 Tax=Vulcanococcus sp. TaxID=2856995 RepID=UPI003F696454
MAFPVGAVIGAVAGIGSSIFGASSAQSQADAQYEAAEAQAKKRFKRDVQEWKLSNLAAKTQWWWDKARVEQLRFNERQKASDYQAYQSQMLNAASQQLSTRIGEINARASIEQNTEFAKASIDYPYRMQALTIDTLETTRQFLNQVNQTALQSAQATSKLNRETEELVSSLALEEQRDYLGWQLNKIQALVEDSKAGARGSDRQGGGQTGKLLMAQAAKQLGRSWGELQNNATSRKVRLGLLNSAIKGEFAQQMGIYALGMQDMTERAASALKRSDNEASMINSTMSKLTIPSFGWRANAYGAQLASAESDYTSSVISLSKPYREEVYFKPLKPIKGLKPEYIGPTQPSTGNLGFTIGNAILSGAQGAMNFSYMNDAGQLKFY